MFFGSSVTNALFSLTGIVALVMALFVAMPVHEFAHAFAAKREGDFTAVAHKRYTLAFHKHFDFTGFMFLILFRFGWAKPVPIDSRNFKRGRKSQFLVSIAGILANLILGTVFLFIYYLIIKIDSAFLTNNLYGVTLGQFLSISVQLNFMLAFFNILPLYPLDGYRIIESFSRFENKFLDFMKRYSIIIYIVFALSSVYYYYFNYTGGLLIEGLSRLFILILGL